MLLEACGKIGALKHLSESYCHELLSSFIQWNIKSYNQKHPPNSLHTSRSASELDANKFKLLVKNFPECHQRLVAIILGIVLHLSLIHI